MPVNFSLLINKNERKIPSIISIHPTNGEVRLANLLNFEECQLYNFNVLALIKLENRNVESYETLIQLQVIDINDTLPLILENENKVENKMIIVKPL